MRLHQEGGGDVARGEVVIVVGTVEVRRHGRDEVAAILSAVGPAQLNASDLRDGVPLVRGLQRAGQQRILPDRLFGKAWIDAGRAEEQELLDTRELRRVDDVGLDREIVVEKFARARVVGEDSADGRGRQDDDLRPSALHPGLDLRLTAQIDVTAADGEDLTALGREPPHDRRSDHAAMAGDPHPLALQKTRRVTPRCHSAGSRT